MRLFKGFRMLYARDINLYWPHWRIQLLFWEGDGHRPGSKKKKHRKYNRSWQIWVEGKIYVS